MKDAKEFYDIQYMGSRYANTATPEDHGHYSSLVKFIKTFNLKKKKCLEVGCGRGFFQDLVNDYTGLDISDSAKRFFHKPFIVGSATALPFPDNQFDAVWSITVLEHIPDPEQALIEICRVLKPSGLLFLSPAWQCRSWAAEGYPVRSYTELDIKGKMIKVSIPMRGSVIFRALFIFPKRIYTILQATLYNKPVQLRFKKLDPNYETFWMSDSDACSSIDPYDVIHWFCSRGHECLNYNTLLRQFLIRTGPLHFKVNKNQSFGGE